MFEYQLVELIAVRMFGALYIDVIFGSHTPLEFEGIAEETTDEQVCTYWL